MSPIPLGMTRCVEALERCHCAGGMDVWAAVGHSRVSPSPFHDRLSPPSEHPPAPCVDLGRVVQGRDRDTMTPADAPGHPGQSWVVESSLSTSLAHTLGQL